VRTATEVSPRRVPPLRAVDIGKGGSTRRFNLMPASSAPIPVVRGGRSNRRVPAVRKDRPVLKDFKVFEQLFQGSGSGIWFYKIRILLVVIASSRGARAAAVAQRLYGRPG
jgi:hypothetical protein